jgi:hypothetical protein
VSRAGFCDPARPGAAITAARFLDGTYHPLSVNPSLVVKVTFS